LIDLTFKNNLAPQQGRVLISDPFKNDEYFERSVVYLCEHSAEATFGFVINKPIVIAIEGGNVSISNERIPAFKGGPVAEQTLFYLHTLGDKIKFSKPVGNGIFLGSNFEELNKVITLELIEEGAIKLFAGYSGWNPRQLEEEIKNNAWVVADVKNNEEIMLVMEDVWSYFMSELGDKYRLMTKFPLDPNFN
jgi:putative transcriptional regulator